MPRVWLRTKFDYGMNMQIPHSENIAHAMYGFRQLGAEIVPYHNINEIYEKVEREDIVLDYVEQCQAIFRKFSVTPYFFNYPEIMKPFMERRIWKDTINSISQNEYKWSAGYFVKPVHDKAFTGKIISSISNLVGCGNYSEDYEVIVSEPINMDIRPYGWDYQSAAPGYLYHYDVDTVKHMMEVFCAWKCRPSACSMDICYTAEGKTLLVEFNDAYALGCYGLPSLSYSKLISARWAQLLGYQDEYKELL